MRVEQLKYLEEIIKCQSISAAANKLYINQSTLSQALKSLESELGAELVIRKNNGVVLSPIGEKLFPIIENIITECDFLFNYTQNHLFEIDNYFINITPSISPLFSQNIFSEVKKIYPSTKFHIAETFSQTSFNNIIKHKADISIALCRKSSLKRNMALAKKEDIICEPLFFTGMDVIFNHKNDLNTHTVIKKGDLRDYHMLAIEGMLHPNKIGSTKAADYLDYYQNLDIFPNYYSIFDILVKNVDAVATIAHCLTINSIYFKNELLSAKPMLLNDEDISCIYAYYRKNDCTNITKTILTLLKQIEC